MKARWPWFAIWVPVALILYLVVNGGRWMEPFWARRFGCPMNNETPMPTLLVHDLCHLLIGPWGFLIWPCLAIFAYVSYLLSPQWSGAVQLFSRVACLALLLFLLLCQLGLSIPVLFKVKAGAMPPGEIAKRSLWQTWKPHFSLPDRDTADSALGCVRSGHGESGT